MRGKFISGATAVLLLAFFFLPWISVSLNGRILGQFSGYQLAVGVGGYALDGLNGRSVLFLVPLLALVVLLGAILAHYQPSWQVFTAVGQAGAALLGLLVLGWQWGGGENVALTFSLELGLWLTLFCFVLILGGAALTFKEGCGRGSKPVELVAPSEQTVETAVIPLHAIDTPIPENPLPKSMPQSLNEPGAQTNNLSTQAWLVVLDEDVAGEKFRVVPPMRIGRDQGNDIVIEDSSMSGYHAVVREQGGAFHIQDLNSTNGIYLENQTNHQWQRVPAATLVHDMRIKLGRTIFRIIIE